jgi:hypothetical protein
MCYQLWEASNHGNYRQGVLLVTGSLARMISTQYWVQNNAQGKRWMKDDTCIINTLEGHDSKDE